MISFASSVLSIQLFGCTFTSVDLNTSETDVPF